MQNKKRRIIYEIYFPAFCKDLQDLTDRIHYFKELGVTTLWLTPIFPSFTEHGYDTTDYFNIKKEYGTLEDFDNFVKKAHENGLEVLLDLVLCHTSSEHKLFKDSIQGKNDCYFWSDKKLDDTWKICNDNGQYYQAKWYFTMPQLNNQSETVRDMIKDIIKFWLIDHNIDGFRLDAIIYASGNPIEFWKWFCDEVYKIKPNAYIVGEAWDTFEVSNKYAMESGMKTFNFEQAGYIKDSIINNKSLQITNNEENAVIFLDNHDQTRIMVSFNHNIEKVKKALDLMFNFKNNDICIYYGSEIGMGVPNGHVQCGGYGDFYSRTKMDWHEVERQRRDPNSLFNYMKKLIKEYKK
ncbi:MAG: alpha-amylase family glycosyl hydrolase [Clostridia bacterium]